MGRNVELTEEQRKLLAEIGRIGGSRKTSAKRRACRENGKKGGRPKKKKPVALQNKPADKLLGMVMCYSESLWTLLGW